MRVLNVVRLGDRLHRYCEFQKTQRRLHDLRKNGAISDTLLTLQYSPVYTVGKRGKLHHLLKSPEELRGEGFDVEWIDRGGEVTYHGPGQIVMYPIVSLREMRLGARLFVEKLEDVMIRVALHYGLSAVGQIKDRTGVWIDDKKVGAIGVRISSGISSHGVALNVKADLQHYRSIIPCGLSSEDVTNLKNEAPDRVESVEQVEAQMVESFNEEFCYESMQTSNLPELFQQR